MRLYWLCVTLAACIHPSSHECSDGRTCGANAICDTVHHECVSQDQLDKCHGVDDRTPCTSDVTVGLCDLGVCLAACGDGATQVGEQCDDGNFISHDGCSSVCSQEAGVWSRIPDPWSARWGHVLAYDEQRQVLVMFGGVTGGEDGTDAKVSGETWERSGGVWSLVSTAGPPARRLAVMAYDTDRHVSVLFSGLDDADSRPADTWEYDGTWRKVATAVAPIGRIYSTMAYNSTTKKMVLYGGIDETAVRSDAWQYDGSNWTPLTTAGTGPGARLAVMAFDASRDHLVVFAQDQTWELANDGTWTAQTGTQPSARRFESMTYVPDRNVVVMTGGRDLSGPFLNDTWEYTTGWTRAETPSALNAVAFGAIAGEHGVATFIGGIDPNGSGTRAIWQYATTGLGPSWTLLATGLVPSARIHSPLVYDPLRREIVAYGDGRSPSTDTFDGTRWHRRADGPPTRVGHAETFDPARGKVVMFAGEAATGPVADTWTWDGLAWSMLATGTAPPARVLASMAADPQLGRVVLFGGGSTFLDNDLADTWELDGNTWTPIATQRHPAPGGGNAMVYDADLGHIVLFDTSGATWEYVDRDWTEIEVSSPTPQPRTGPVFVYDSSRHRAVLYGGSHVNTLLDDMWDFDGVAWTPISYDVAPMAVVGPGGAYLEPTRSLVLFGGGSPNATQQQWQFRYRSQVPDENCANSKDDDGDALVDLDDPDCN